jgi:hypothetical protein
MMRRPLRRFWFPLPGHLGIGVTAPSESAARALAERVRAEFWPASPALGEVVADVDIQTLDQNHVVPNMEALVWEGVWYPRGFQKPHS